jgi:hypothetical protein
MKFFLTVSLFYLPLLAAFALFLTSCNWYTHRQSFTQEFTSADYFTFDVITEPKLLKKWYWLEPYTLVDGIRNHQDNTWLFSYTLPDSFYSQGDFFNIIWKEDERNAYQNDYGSRMYKVTHFVNFWIILTLVEIFF